METINIIIICIAVCVIIVLCITFLIMVNTSVFDFMPGFWVADSDFLISSDLSSAYIMLEPKQSGEMKGFLSMTNKSDVNISNQKITLSNFSSMTVGKNTYKISNVKIVYADSDVLPTTMNIIVDLNSGIMTLSDDKKLYAVFIKDNETTNSI
jgi:hypothetical protein